MSQKHRFTERDDPEDRLLAAIFVWCRPCVWEKFGREHSTFQP